MAVRVHVGETKFARTGPGVVLRCLGLTGLMGCLGPTFRASLYQVIAVLAHSYIQGNERGSQPAP